MHFVVALCSVEHNLVVAANQPLPVQYQTTMAVDPLLYFFPSLSEVDVDSPIVRLIVVFSTFVFFTVVFFLAFLLSFNLYTFKHVLSKKDKIFWCLAMVRAVYGVTSTSLGAWYLFVDDSLRKSILYSHTVTSELAINYTVGFFLFECMALYASNVLFRTFDPFLCTHHTLSLLGYSTSLYYQNGHFFAMIALTLEMSTPFSCLCWVLIKCKLANTLLWKANQFFLVHLFHGRSFIEAYCYYMSYWQYSEMMQAPLPVLIFLYFPLTIQFIILTPYWTWKKTQQLLKPVDWNVETQINGDIANKLKTN